MDRIQKIISHAGVASRRKAETLIASGKVTVNGKKAALGDKADPEKDNIRVDGKKLIIPRTYTYLMMNKPSGYITARNDPHGRKTVYDLLPKKLKASLWHVGRLDYNTEGLLLFTNDGEFTNQLTHPRYEHEKEYEVTVKTPPTKQQLDMLRKGVNIKTGTTYPARVVSRKQTVRITIHEGKNHQVRDMIASVGLTLKSLKRIRINNLILPTTLKTGSYRHIKRSDIV